MVKPISQRLRREILTGRYRPGDRLPPERELATRLGTNRNTLREALRTLESERLIEARQGDGTRVLDWRAIGEINLLPWFLAEPTPDLERYDAVMTLLALREGLLDEALARAAVQATPADLDRVQAAIARLRSAAPGPAQVEADVELYRELVLAAHNLVIAWVFNTFARIFVELGRRFHALWVIDAPYLESLERILKALRAGRGDRARAELKRLLTDRGAELDAPLHAIAGKRGRK